MAYMGQEQLVETTGSMANIKKPGVRFVMFSNCAGPDSKCHKICAKVSTQEEFENLIKQCREFVAKSKYVATVVKVGDNEIFACGKNGKEYRSKSLVDLPNVICTKIFQKDILSESTTAMMKQKPRKVAEAIKKVESDNIDCERHIVDYGLIVEALRQSVNNIRKSK